MQQSLQHLESIVTFIKKNIENEPIEAPIIPERQCTERNIAKYEIGIRSCKDQAAKQEAQVKLAFQQMVATLMEARRREAQLEAMKQIVTDKLAKKRRQEAARELSLTNQRLLAQLEADVARKPPRADPRGLLLQSFQLEEVDEKEDELQDIFSSSSSNQFYVDVDFENDPSPRSLLD
jgi:hypothetical protein